ncbi:MAG: copper resistance protein CopC [Gemmatimonadales bacterium]
MKRIFSPIAVLALLVGLGAGTVAAMHNHLTRSAPAEDETLASSPRTIELWFKEKPSVAFSSINLLAADGAKLAVGKPTAGADSLAVRATLGAALGPGTYTVVWRTASDDGHAVRGRFAFKVAGE